MKPYVIVKKKQLKLAQELILYKSKGYTKETVKKMIEMSKIMSNYNSYPNLSV